MALPLDTLVIALGPEDGGDLINVTTVGEVTRHIHDHVIAAAANQAAAAIDEAAEDGRRPKEGGDRLLRFFTPDGEFLRLSLLADWFTLVLEPTGERIGLETLQREVYAVLDSHRAEWDQIFAAEGEQAPEIPPRGSWLDQLKALSSDLTLFGATGHPHNSQGPVHNLFVHGGRV